MDYILEGHEQLVALCLLLFPVLQALGLLLFWDKITQKWLRALLLIFGQLAIIVLTVIVNFAGNYIVLNPWNNWTFIFNFHYLSLWPIINVAVLTTVALVFSLGYMNRDSNPKRFLALLSLCEAALLSFLAADNWQTLCGCLAIYSMISALLTAYYYSDLDKVKRAQHLLILDGISFLALLALVIMLQDSRISFAGYRQLGDFNDWLMLVVIVTRFAIIPCHIWIGELAAAPSPASALLQAGYNFIILAFLWFLWFPKVNSAPLLVILILAIITMIVASFYGLLQWNIKRLLSYIVLARLSFCLAAASIILKFADSLELIPNDSIAVFGKISNYSSGILTLLNCDMWSLFTLYLGGAVVIRWLGDQQQIDLMGKLKRKLPVVLVMTILCLYQLMPLPGTITMRYCWRIVVDLWNSGHDFGAYYLLLVLYLFGEVLFAAMVTRYVVRLFFKEPIMFMPNIEESKLPLTMSIALWVGMVVTLAGPVWYLISSDLLAQSFSHGHYLVSLPSLLAIIAAVIYLANPRRHYFPGHYRALRYEHFMGSLFGQTLLKPLIFISEVVVKRFINHGLRRFIQNALSFIVRLSGYFAQVFHRGDLRYYLAILIIAIAGCLLFLWGQK